jgi:hypothetical protein
VRDRVSLRKSHPEPLRRSAVGSLGGMGSQGSIKSRLSLKSTGEGDGARMRPPPKRITPPRFDDKPSSVKVRTTVSSTSNIKSRLALKNHQSEDRKMER